MLPDGSFGIYSDRIRFGCEYIEWRSDTRRDIQNNINKYPHLITSSTRVGAERVGPDMHDASRWWETDEDIFDIMLAKSGGKMWRIGVGKCLYCIFYDDDEVAEEDEEDEDKDDSE